MKNDLDTIKKQFPKVVFTLPAHWASALINGDTSGLSDEDEKAVEKFEKENPNLSCVGCSDESFFQHENDATKLGGDCLEYTFLEFIGTA